MKRKVFFSFQYEPDIVRVSRIRNSGVINAEGQKFLDKAEWEEVKRKGDSAIKNWIDSNMTGTSVLVLCIGETTIDSKWVNYEIKKAYDEGRGIVGVYLNGMKNFEGTSSIKGKNPMDNIMVNTGRYTVPLSSIFDSYSWNDNDGYNNMHKWIEIAAKKVGR